MGDEPQLPNMNAPMIGKQPEVKFIVIKDDTSLLENLINIDKWKVAMAFNHSQGALVMLMREP